MKTVLLFWTCLLHFSLSAQTPKIKVYLLGTFHFAQTDSTYDVRSEKNQQSIATLCEMIAKQKPDKVFLEAMPDFEKENKLDSHYQVFRKTGKTTYRNEIWQVGFRVANKLNHPHVYFCDHPGQYGIYYGQLETYAREHGQTDLLNYHGKGMTKPITESTNTDSLRNASDLIDYLRWMNSDAVLSASHAHYLNVYPQLGNTNVFQYDSTYLLGAELTADWYRRNIMIYSKMINQLDYKEKAIFLIIGNDHIPILRHLFESNPYFEVVDTQTWLGKTNK